MRYHFHFAGTESIHFFWAVDRMSEGDLQKQRLRDNDKAAWRFNMTTVDKEFQVFTSGARNQGIPTRLTCVTVPVMTNMGDLRKGERLIFQVQKRALAEKRQMAAWHQHADEAERKRLRGEKDAGASKQTSGRKLSVGVAPSKASSSGAGNMKQTIM